LDLYQGKVTVNPLEARKLKRALPADGAIRGMKAAFEYLAHRPDVDPKHIGSIGWSMGGTLALQLAIHEPRLAACVVNYGSLPTNPSDPTKINARVLGIFGSRDRGIPPHKVRAFEQCMHSINKSVEVKIYESAGHAFENPANKRGYRPDAASDVWLRALAFLAKSL
jgi:carboxymethylenebutenolidase